MSTEAETVTTEAEISERIAPGVMLRRLARGELGSIRVLLGIAVIWTIFQIANDRFLSAVNLSNLSLQVAAVATISIGVVLVLLLGEIDLSVGAVSGLAAAVMAVLSVKEGLDPGLAILAGLAVGCAIGMFNGFMVTVVRNPVVRRHPGRPARVAGSAVSRIWAIPARSICPTRSSPTSPRPSSTRRSAGPWRRLRSRPTR